MKQPKLRMCPGSGEQAKSRGLKSREPDALCGWCSTVKLLTKRGRIIKHYRWEDE